MQTHKIVVLTIIFYVFTFSFSLLSAQSCGNAKVCGSTKDGKSVKNSVVAQLSPKINLSSAEDNASACGGGSCDSRKVSSSSCQGGSCKCPVAALSSLGSSTNYNTCLPVKNMVDFELPLMDTGQSISREKLLGDFYLLDLWKTDCGHCLDEIPNLAKVYQKYKDRNFKIISISLDRDAEAVKKFQTNYKMPWMNVHLNISTKQAQDYFRILKSPAIFLVSPDGVILAEGFDLSAENLDRTLARYLGAN